jgi:hypothetical protein
MTSLPTVGQVRMAPACAEDDSPFENHLTGEIECDWKVVTTYPFERYMQLPQPYTLLPNTATHYACG